MVGTRSVDNVLRPEQGAEAMSDRLSLAQATEFDQKAFRCVRASILGRGGG